MLTALSTGCLPAWSSTKVGWCNMKPNFVEPIGVSRSSGRQIKMKATMGKLGVTKLGVTKPGQPKQARKAYLM